MTKIKLTDLKRELKDWEQKELIQLIGDLYKLDKNVQQFLSNKFMGDEAIQDYYEKSKEKITEQFFPDRGDAKLKLSEAKKAISDFKKMTDDHDKTVDLMLYYVEIGTEFTNTYGDIDESFYNSMLIMYGKVIDECVKNKTLYTKLGDRLRRVMEDSNGIGWGYHDTLIDLYYSLEDN